MQNHLLLILFVCLSLLNCSKSGKSSLSTSSGGNTTTSVPPEEPTPTPLPTPLPPISQPVAMAALPLLQGPVQLIVTPNAKGHVEFLQSINRTISGDIIRMTMFHLTHSDIINALVAAQKRGVTVKVILDNASLILPNFKYGFDQLKAGGVDVRASSSAFTISHSKSIIINNSEVFITAINLTKLEDVTRDFGLILHDAAVVSEVINVFEQDWQNTSSQQGLTSSVSELHLVWSPVNSLTKIISVISAAKKSIVIQVENLGEVQIQSALIAAVKRGVAVRVILPMCSKGGSAKLNYPYLKELSTNGVQTKVMPTPESPEKPYLHSKMMVADAVVAYIGSVNFSRNSTSRARELGILFSEPAPIKHMLNIFEVDWNSGISVPDENNVSCSLI